MSSEEVIRVQGLSKKYHIYDQPHHRLLQMFYGPRRLFFREFWALDNVNFSVRAGECVGIVGRNGAGKSTLLQIIAGTLTPTSGLCDVRGRVAAMLELGSGFNPEFSGRDNVRMNATLLGFSEEELKTKFDDILRFAEIGAFVDQPVKTYSSGMKMRLAFSVLAHLEPDVLIVDEALSVGDGAFQVKCMTYMRNLIARGTTVLLVSHNVTTIRTFCDRAIWLDNGQARQQGSAADVCSAYMEFLFSGGVSRGEDLLAKPQSTVPVRADHLPMMELEKVPRGTALRRWGTGHARIHSLGVHGDQSGMHGYLTYGERVQLEFRAIMLETPPDQSVAIAFSLRDVRGIDVIAISSSLIQQYVPSPEAGSAFTAQFSFECDVTPGKYVLIVAVECFVESKRTYLDYVENAYPLEIVSERLHFGIIEPKTDIKIVLEKA